MIAIPTLFKLAIESSWVIPVKMVMFYPSFCVCLPVTVGFRSTHVLLKPLIWHCRKKMETFSEKNHPPDLPRVNQHKCGKKHGFWSTNDGFSTSTLVFFRTMFAPPANPLATWPSSIFFAAVRFKQQQLPMHLTSVRNLCLLSSNQRWLAGKSS